MYEGVEVQRHAYLKLPLEGGNCSASRLGNFSPTRRTLMPLRQDAVASWLVLTLWRELKSLSSSESQTTILLSQNQ
jgi:hypothetical protein